MRLTELNPEFLGAGGAGVSTPGPDPCPACEGKGCGRCQGTGKVYIPAPERHGVGVEFDCPCGCDNRCYVPFANPLDGGPSFDSRGWQRTGDTYETLSLTPSILRTGGCPAKWHGYITAGAVLTV